MVASLGLRAAEAELKVDGHQLRTSTTFFVGQVTAGEVDIEVEVLRRGRTASQVQVEVRNPGSATGAKVIAVFGDSREGPTFTDVLFPEVPAPMDCRSIRDPAPEGFEFIEMPFWQRVESRSAIGHAPWEDFQPGAAVSASWLRFEEPPLLDDGSIDPLGVLTMADRMPGAVREGMGLGRPWFAPSADLTVHHFAPLRTRWMLAYDHARWAGDGWASGESHLWSEDGELVGYATQMMIFTYLDG